MRRRKKLLPWWLVLLLDVLATGSALCVFSLFHHVIPQVGGEPLRTIVDIQVPANIETEGNISGLLTGQSASPAPEYPVGDFTATFPTYDTGVGKMISYQTENIRIAIDKIERDESVCYVADIWVRNISFFKTAFAKDTYGKSITQPVPQIAEAHSALLAMTGDYYGTHSNGVVIRNGILYRNNTYEDVCVLYQDGVMETYKKGEFNMDAAIARGAYQAWSFGPPLLANGEFINGFTHTLAPRNPRAAMGYYEPGHYVFVVVDGRQKGYSMGFTFTELSRLFADLGCKAAYNLDGGESAVMMYKGEFVNKPYKNGRKVSDIVYIGQ